LRRLFDHNSGVAFTISLAALAGRSGRGVSIGVVDSGIHARHPHVLGIAGSVAFDDFGRATPDAGDRLGHGTAVAAAIREKAPEAVLFSAKVFDTTLATTAAALVAAIAWAVRSGVALVNLSLGTDNPDHEAALQQAVSDAAAAGVLIVSAAPQDDAPWLPGGLPGVVGVEVDWDLPRDSCAVLHRNGVVRLRASGFPRPAPGVPPARNFQGPSFAVANATGLIALAIESSPVRSLDELIETMAAVRTD
jgi:subtilisin family serine protease